MFRVVGLVEGSYVARMLEFDRVISDIETSSGTAKTNDDGSPEWRAGEGRGEVGVNRTTSCAHAPAVLYVQY
jgi:hypothetical protein